MAGLLMLGSATVMTSCGDDDDPVVTPEEQQSAADKVAGSYKGNIVVTLEGQQVGNEPKVLALQKKTDTTVDLVINDFTINISLSGATIPVSLGDVKVEDCALTQAADGSYTFDGQVELKELSVPITPTFSVKADCVVKINTAKVKDTSLSLPIDVAVDVKDINMKLNVGVQFDGTKLTGNESSEAKILTFKFDKAVAPVDSLVVGDPVIDESAKTITFFVADTAKAEYLKELVPTITVSENATVTPNSNVKQDFNNPVVYTVMAANGTTAKYTASIKSKLVKYDFETWGAPQAPNDGAEFQEAKGWSSSNVGAFLLKMMSFADTLCVNKDTQDKHSGTASASIITLDSKGLDLGFIKAPKVTTGSLFLGNFITNTENTLLSTKFGIPYANKPVTVKGWFKYTPGKEYYETTKEPYQNNADKATLNKNKSDEYIISAVLYETPAYDTENWSDCLTGVDIYTSDRIVAIAQQTGGAQADWKEFTLNLEYKKEFDATKKYRLAIICSASKDGDKFSGAPGSNLKVDDIEVYSE